MKRLALLCAIIASIAVFAAFFTGRSTTDAVAQDFTITSLNCTSTPGHVQITNQNLLTIGNSPATLGDLAISFTPTGAVAPQTFAISSLISGGPFSVANGASVDLQVGAGATTSPSSPPSLLPTNQTVAVTTFPLLQPGTTVSLVDQGPSPQLVFDSESCPLQGLSRTLTVSTLGFDYIAPGQPNTSCGPDLVGGAPPSFTLPGPCFTIANALTYARDGDTIVVESGVYEICSTLEVPSLVTITAGANTSPGNAKAILHSYSGTTVFHVTAVGAPVGPTGQTQHAAINGLSIGGAFQPGQAAILLDGDAYTDITNTVLGGEQLNNPSFNGEPCPPTQPPLPPGFGFAPPPQMTKLELFGNAASIILQNSDHPNISNNSIIGSAIFKFAPVLTAGNPLSGFGIVTSECLGLAPDSSDGVTIASNLIDRNTNAGIWLCSDGGGFHSIKSNVVRNNGRGIVLRAIADTTVDGNTIGNNYQDGIIVYDASLNNTLSNNIVESHRTSGAAGIRLGGFGGSLFPLQTVLTANKLLRNWTGIVIAGARNTSATNNIITAEDVRTGVLLQAGATGSPGITQPAGTSFHTNTIIANGACGAKQGCAVRLDTFVSTNADFTQNNFGLPGDADVNSVLWHRPNDPVLGFINAQQAPISTSTVQPSTGGLGPVPTVAPGITPGFTPAPGFSSTPGPCVSATPTPACSGFATATATPFITGASAR